MFLPAGRTWTVNRRGHCQWSVGTPATDPRRGDIVVAMRDCSSASAIATGISELATLLALTCAAHAPAPRPRPELAWPAIGTTLSVQQRLDQSLSEPGREDQARWAYDRRPPNSTVPGPDPLARPLAAGRPRWPRRWPPGGTRRPPRQLAGQSGWPASLAAGRARLPSGHGGWPGRLARAVGRRPGYVGQGVGHPVEPVVHRRQLAGQSGWPASLAAGRRPGHVSHGLGHQGNGRPRSAVRWPRRLASVIGQGRWPPVEAPPLPFRFALARPLATGQGQPSAARRPPVEAGRRLRHSSAGQARLPTLVGAHRR